jgi:hypothetical protein
MLFGSRDGFGLEFHPEQDDYLLCVDIFIGGRRVDASDNAFYPPLLVMKLTNEIARFRTPVPPPELFTSPAEAFRIAEGWDYDPTRTEWPPGPEAALASWDFLEWGECTNDVMAYAYPDDDRIHLACRVRDGGGIAWGTEPRHEPTLVSLSRTAFLETLEQCLVVAEREWSARRG